MCTVMALLTKSNSLAMKLFDAVRFNGRGGPHLAVTLVHWLCRDPPPVIRYLLFELTDFH